MADDKSTQFDIEKLSEIALRACQRTSLRMVAVVPLLNDNTYHWVFIVRKYDDYFFAQPWGNAPDTEQGMEDSLRDAFHDLAWGKR